MHPLHRFLVVPAVGLAGLLTVPIAAGADNGESGSDSTTTTVVTTSTSADPTTTAAPTTVVAPSTTQPRTGGIEITKFLGDLIAKVENASIAADVKTSLLARLRAARDAVKNGNVPSNSDMQALLRDVYTAFGRPPGTDAPKPSTTVAPVTTFPRAPESSVGSNRGKSIDTTKALAQLDEMSTKVAASAMSDGDKATRVAAIDRIRQAVVAGTIKLDDLATVKAVVKAALEQHRSAPSTSTTGVPAAPSSVAPSADPSASSTTTAVASTDDERRGRPSGRDAVNGAIDLVTNSPLSDELKQQILGILTQAKTVIEDTTLTPDQVKAKVRELFEAEKTQRLAEAAAKLTRFSEKIATLAFDLGGLPGATDVIVTVHDQLAQANALLATSPLDIATIKAAWKLLHEARTTLQQFLESATTTTTVAETTTVAG